MKWFIKYVAFALLAVWLPATFHCDLEAIGAFVSPHDHHPADNDCCESHSLCSSHGCELVESGAYTPSGPGVKPTAPEALIYVGFVLARLDALDAQSSPILRVRPASGPPLDWLANWQFVRRAAPPARAPGVFV